MSDEQLKNLWQQQPLRSPDISPAQILGAMQNQTSLFRRVIHFRDIRELIACAVVIAIFGYFYFTVYREPISRVGCLIIIGSTIFIAFRLIYTRRLTPPAPPGSSLIESLRAELKSVSAQSRLLGSVLWWYLLPPTIGAMIATWGMRIGIGTKITSTIVFVAVDALVLWLNRWARAKQLVPMEAQLQSLLHSAETGQPLDQSHVAALRPIAISMAAAEKARPVEFRVAFWQLALYGEPGIVGIWFFWMLSRTMDDRAHRFTTFIDFLTRLFSPQHLAWLPLFVIGGLVYSWLIQKSTERAVGISVIGIHLARGQVLILWDEIKEVRIFRMLNIRSLWLIKENGEKMIMPWSSLENHAALKSAVERCAPPNHVIRKFLNLLRR